MIIQLLKRVKRVLEYIPIIWKTHDWDHSYSLQIYAYSLKRLKRCIENGYGLDRNKYAKRLQVVINLIERMEDSEKTMEHRYELLDKEFGESDIQMESSEDNFGFFTMKENNPRRNTEEYKKRLNQYLLEARRLNEKDHRLLSKYLFKYSKQFWD